MATLKIPSGHRIPLKKLAELKSDQFESLKAALRTAEPSMSKAQFAKNVAQLTPSVPDVDVQQIVGMVCSIYPAKEAREKSADEIAADIRETLNTSQPIPGISPNSPLVETIATRMRDLLAIDGPVGLTSKAFDVATEHERFCCGTRIYSDIRPIFSPSADTILGSVIIHNLNISYHQDGTHKDFYVALDNDDIQALKKLIERAEKKTAQLKSVIQASKIPYLDVK
jgi:hypothetical protein